jgi:putative protease
MRELHASGVRGYVALNTLVFDTELPSLEAAVRGLAAFTPSFDLDAAQLATLCATPFGPWAEVVVHHPVPLFPVEHCVIAALLSEGATTGPAGAPASATA